MQAPRTTKYSDTSLFSRMQHDINHKRISRPVGNPLLKVNHPGNNLPCLKLVFLESVRHVAVFVFFLVFFRLEDIFVFFRSFVLKDKLSLMSSGSW
jgi:hypothetical protein